MTSLVSHSNKGIVYTFYSFKGGVGRTMALANVAALLAKWGRSVLVVDWDLEAPGVERFFSRDIETSRDIRSSKPGIVDLITGHRDRAVVDWKSCLHSRQINGSSGSVSIITAGKEDGEYAQRLQSINFGDLFEHQQLGTYIEELRDSWTSEFDFVLIDSRTGVTDIGGICTVHLADILVLLFTATDSSTLGAKDVIDRARKAQSTLPLDRSRLLAVPVPSRDESRTEYERAAAWKQIYAKEFETYYTDWLPSGIKAIDAVEMLGIPYVPYWSFGEQLPAIEEGTKNPGTLGYSFQILARLLAVHLNWYEALDGQTLSSRQSLSSRQMNGEWLAKHRHIALFGLQKMGGRAFMEASHFCVDVEISENQAALLSAARQAVVSASDFPLALVLDTLEEKPRPEKDGIVAEIASLDKKHYNYWALATNGNFYTLSSNPEYAAPGMFPDVVVARTAEALIHAVTLYRALGIDAAAEISLSVGHFALRGRTLISRTRSFLPVKENRSEDQYSSTVRFRLSSLESRLVELTRSLCEGLFMLFDFASFPDKVYADIITSFLAGKPL